MFYALPLTLALAQELDITVERKKGCRKHKNQLSSDLPLNNLM